ncbi:MAG: hypothetical protein JW888_01630 [Pirellulales bacterium]|nr:hypothetical protein [Pirellulales bacterium]
MDSLDDRVSRIKADGKGKPWDCVVGVSGGRDSSYLLRELTRKHNLRCLAVYYRTPFTGQVAHENVLRMVERLNTDLEIMNLSAKFHQELARYMVILWAKKRQWMFANLACAQCKLLNGEIFRVARKHDVKWILYGSNAIESFQGATWRRSSASDSQGAADRHFSFLAQMRRMMAVVRKGTELLVLCPGLWRHWSVMFQASILYLTPNTPYIKLRYPGVNVLHYFYYAGWKEEECERTLKELGWQLPFGSGTTWRADCTFAAFKDYMLQETAGMTYMDSMLSNMIRAGMLTRDEAMKRLEDEQEVFPAKIRAALDVLDLPGSISLPNVPINRGEKRQPHMLRHRRPVAEL